MEDKLVTCEHCQSEMCYSTKISETGWAYQCPSCGFSSSDLIKFGEVDLEMFEAEMPELYKDLKFIDSKNRIWYPIIHNTEDGIVFIEGTNANEWEWVSVKNRALTEEEVDQYKHLDKPAPPYKSDFTTKQGFGKLGFLLALNSIEKI